MVSFKISFSILEDTRIIRYVLPLGKRGRGIYKIDVVVMNDDNMEIVFCECKWKVNVDADEKKIGMRSLPGVSGEG